MIPITIPRYEQLAPCGCFSTFKDQDTDFLKEYKHWFMALNWEQGFLGRSLLFLKRHAVDEVELNEEEVLEKHSAYLDWHRAVTGAFQPDKINQAQLGNEEYLHKGHIHWHFVPRYRRPIAFAGEVFQSDDGESQKRIYSDIHKRMVYPVDIRKKIKEKLSLYL